jgi:hypothetical protein
MNPRSHVSEHVVSHPPLKPVWPVRKIDLPRQNSRSNDTYNTLQGAAPRPRISELLHFPESVHALPETFVPIHRELLTLH